MDRFYDTSAASHALSRITKQMREQGNSLFLTDFEKMADNTYVHVVENDSPHEWRLYKTEDDAECIFALQGVVCMSDLPPFKKRTKDNQIPYLRQSIAITGLGIDNFTSSIEAVARIVAFFSRDVGQNKLKDIEFISMYQNFPVMHLSNRYFSRRDQVSSGDEVDFDRNVDPLGILTKMKGQKYCHALDNVVYYCERLKEGDDPESYPSIKPDKIHIGDIIEVALSFAVYPLAKGRAKITAVLKSITLIDGKYTRESAASRALSNMIPKMVAYPKRKNTYSDGAINHTRERLERMSVDSEKNPEEVE